MGSEALWNVPADAVGLALLLFVPGWYAGRLCLPPARIPERVASAVVLSLALNLTLGLALAGLGLFRPGWVWGASAALSAGLFGVHLLVHREPF